MNTPLAHSSPRPGALPDPYPRHVQAVRDGARERAQAILAFATPPPPDFLRVIDAASTFHDLGKLDPDIQATLRRGRGGRLEWDHIDAGVAYLRMSGHPMAAWLVRAHHAPGLPQKAEHFDPDDLGRRLRGRRRDNEPTERHNEQIARTDAFLNEYIAVHEAAVGTFIGKSNAGSHGLTMRLALSCLVDADHSDTAFSDTGQQSTVSPEPRWAERLEALHRYVHNLPVGTSDEERARNRRRASFFEACLDSPIKESMVACEGPVGLGKTTAVAAYLLRRARDEGLRRLFIVAPYTNILSQTAGNLRKALVLPGEQPDQVIVEHHHRADFKSRDDRDLAVLWNAPIVLTTAVSLFETLAACDPASLRKFHAVPGSAIFLDEAHAALPTRLWPQNWCWLRELAEKWSCRFVFASGSLARFWSDGDIVKEPIKLPELLPKAQADDVLCAERSRVKYSRLCDGRVVDVNELIDFVRDAPGPRLVILNTVQNAAVVARGMRKSKMKVLHLSTALCPGDRECVLARIMRRLEAGWKNWTLVATSCVEAGVDFSFRSAFRERFSVSSAIQIGGRVNRHGEYDAIGGGTIYDFALSGEGITQHPAAEISAEVLRGILSTDDLNRCSPADIVTKAMQEELSRGGGLSADLLAKAELERDYPTVAKHGRVIDADTRLVVVDPKLKRRLANYEPVSLLSLLRGSVQLWTTRIDKLGLEPLHSRDELYTWRDTYDPDFLGYMAGVLKNQPFMNDPSACVI